MTSVQKESWSINRSQLGHNCAFLVEKLLGRRERREEHDCPSMTSLASTGWGKSAVVNEMHFMSLPAN